MRVQHWLATLVGASGLLLGAQHGLYAQQPPGAYQIAPPQYGQVLAGPPSAPSGPPASYNASLTGPEYGGYPQVIPPVPPPIGPTGVDGQAIQPYPTTSPFDNGYTNFMNLGGIWDRIQRNTDRHWYFDTDMLFISTRATQGIFGNPGAQTYVRQIRDFLDTTSTSTGGGGTGGGGTGTGSTGSTNVNAADQLLINEGFILNTPAQIAGEFNYYNAVNLNNLGDPTTQGARFTLGMWNPDHSGWAAAFWFGGTAVANFNAADDLTQHPTDLPRLEQIIRFLQNASPLTIGQLTSLDDIDVDLGGVGKKDLTASQVLQMNLLNLRGLPVGDGTPRGQTIPYDIYFDVRVTSAQIGTKFDYYFTPFLERKWLTVNAMAGVEYLNIRESLSFLGIDSGLLYGNATSTSSSGSTGSTTTGVFALEPRDFKAQSTPNGIDDNQDGIIDNAGATEPGPVTTSGTGGGGGGTGSTSTSTSTILIGLPSPFALLPATIDELTNTNLVGPTIGLHYQIGGDKFHLIGETKFGLMANFETMEISGNNIGNLTRVDGTAVVFPAELTGSRGPVQAEFQQNLFIPAPSDPNPNAFESSQNHSHVSPLIEQSLTAEAPVFQYIPVLGKMWPFANANLRVGYTFIWVGDVITTNQSVDYEGSPMTGLKPRIEIDHQSWWSDIWSVGASWNW
jgi:hypothetical protein